MNKTVQWLKEMQDDLQREYKKILSKTNKYDFRSVHLSVTCGCGYSYDTPYWIKDNAKCRKCGKKITTFRKEDDALSNHDGGQE